MNSMNGTIQVCCTALYSLAYCPAVIMRYYCGHVLSHYRLNHFAMCGKKQYA